MPHLANRLFTGSQPAPERGHLALVGAGVGFLSIIVVVAVFTSASAPPESTQNESGTVGSSAALVTPTPVVKPCGGAPSIMSVNNKLETSLAVSCN